MAEKIRLMSFNEKTGVAFALDTDGQLKVVMTPYGQDNLLLATDEIQKKLVSTQRFVLLQVQQTFKDWDKLFAYLSQKTHEFNEKFSRALADDFRRTDEDIYVDMESINQILDHLENVLILRDDLETVYRQLIRIGNTQFRQNDEIAKRLLALWQKIFMMVVENNSQLRKALAKKKKSQP